MAFWVSETGSGGSSSPVARRCEIAASVVLVSEAQSRCKSAPVTDYRLPKPRPAGRSGCSKSVPIRRDPGFARLLAPPATLLLGSASHAEAQCVAPKARRAPVTERSAADRRARAPTRAPVPAPEHPERIPGWFCCIGLRRFLGSRPLSGHLRRRPAGSRRISLGRVPVIRPIENVPAPFVHVAVHVVQSECIRSITADRGRSAQRRTLYLGSIGQCAIAIALGGIVGRPKAEGSHRSCATGVFPLRFRRQTIAAALLDARLRFFYRAVALAFDVDKQVVRPPPVLLAQLVAEFDRIVPGDVLDGIPAGVDACGGFGRTSGVRKPARVASHHAFELALSDFIDAEIEGLRNPHPMLRLIATPPCLGFRRPHLKLPRRDERELHPE